MLTSKKDEIQQRLNSILEKLSGITFVPENWKEDVFWTTIEEAGLSKYDVLEQEENLFFQQLVDLQFPWEHMEKLADILVALDTHQPNQAIKEVAKESEEKENEENQGKIEELIKEIKSKATTSDNKQILVAAMKDLGKTKITEFNYKELTEVLGKLK